MKAAIISDIHLGDSNSVMAYRDADNNIKPGSKYYDFRKKIQDKFNKEPLNYLILMGDILDFSVSSYYNSYQIGQFFFQQLKKDNITERIIYIPGNHDFDIWNTIEYEANIIRNVKDCKSVAPFKISVPVIIDERAASPIKGVTLDKVAKQKQTLDLKFVVDTQQYGGLFPDYLTMPPIPFYFGYPNIYFITEKETILITHGQYLEPFWSVTGEWGMKILKQDIPLKNPELPDMYEMISLNIPLSVFSCSALGQAGILSPLVQRIEHEIKGHNVTRIDYYLDNLGKELRSRTKGVLKLFFPLIYSAVKKQILDRIKNMESGLFNDEFINNPDVRKRFSNFYATSVYEVNELKEKYSIDIPLPTKMIFGHTHQPVPWNSPKAVNIELPQLPKGTKFKLFNTGGWINSLDKHGQIQFCGAEIFFYDDVNGFTSESIGY